MAYLVYSKSAFNNVFSELQLKEKEEFRRYLRINTDSYMELLFKVRPIIELYQFVPYKFPPTRLSCIHLQNFPHKPLYIFTPHILPTHFLTCSLQK